MKREKKTFFKKNEQLFDQLNKNDNNVYFDNIWCSLNQIKLQVIGFNSKIYLIPNGIVITENYSLNFSPNSKLYANTYLLTEKDNFSDIPPNLFRNFGKISNIIVKENGQIELEVVLHQHVAFPYVNFTSNSYKTYFSFRLPLDKEEVIFLLKKTGFSI